MSPSRLWSLPVLTPLLFMLALLQPVSGHAELTWETREIVLTAKSGQHDVVGLYRFKNTGSSPITITAVETSCGCTTAELAQRTYAPGETGEIKAVFTLGDRVSLQEKQIRISTDDAPTSPTTLTLSVTIPEPLTCTPRLLLWRTGGTPTEKSAKVTATGAQTITALEPHASNPATVTLHVEPLAAGTQYRITVRPASLDQPANFPVSFIARFSDHTTHAFTLYVLVK